MASEPAARGFYALRLMNLFDDERSYNDKDVVAEKSLNTTQNASPKPRSKEQVQWMMLDRRGI